MPAATYYSHGDGEPTNGRPWPGTHVTITASGLSGVVGDYEYWWPTGKTFPVELDTTPGVYRNYTPRQISPADDTTTATTDDPTADPVDVVDIPTQSSARTPRTAHTSTEPVPETAA